MKTKDVLSITLKIIGLIAFWKAIQTFGAVISGIGIFSSLFANNDQMNSSFMIAIGLALILNFLLPLLVAILFLFRTEKVLSIIKNKEQDNVDLNLNKLVLFHMIIIVFGFLTIIHGAGNFIEFNYKTDTKTEYTTNNVSHDNQSPNITSQEKVAVTNSKSKNINYFALVEIIFGIILLIKATQIAKQLERNFDSKTGGQID
jgi:phosphate/sulfate permease